jgi:UDP-N-acetyl-D-galactosamine dehydrogenase
VTHGRKVSVIGLGYVGLPVAVALARRGRVIGFDVSAERVRELSQGRDHTGEIDASELARAQVVYTTDPERLREADFHIVAVPTPVDEAKRPDLGPLLRASETLGPRLRPGQIVVFESTVYPGATEEVCGPVLERSSGLRAGRDFFLGYSPERINPGDREHGFAAITKVISAQTPEALEAVARVYGSVVEAGVFRASSIAVAEAAKVIENTQRDLNIALMNELALIFGRLGLDTRDVLAAARTKWNFLPFDPGLVGGHCIGVDPYYLTHRATIAGYIPQVILAGRAINDDMGHHVGREVVKQLLRMHADLRGAIVTVLGLTFKENVADLRNTRVIDIVRELEDHGLRVQVHDPVADPADARREHGVELLPLERLEPARAVVLAVPHAVYVEKGWELVTPLLDEGWGVVADVKGRLPREATPPGVRLWRL